MLARIAEDTLRDVPRGKPVLLRGRFMEVATGVETPCILSWDGVELLLRSSANPAPGASVLCYPEAIGRLTGMIEARSHAGASLRVTGLPQYVDRVFKRLDYVMEHGLVPDDQRGEARFVPTTVETSFRVGSDGPPREARIVDVSRSGVSLETDAALAEGTRIFVGKRGAVVVRATPKGFAARFALPLPFTDMGPSVVL